MLKLHRDKKHKFKDGFWTVEKGKLKFNSHLKQHDKFPDSHLIEEIGIQFVDYVDEAKEAIFRGKFQRPNDLVDSDVVTLQDIKNVALFTMQNSGTPKYFITMVQQKTYDQFLHSLINYIDFFLMIVEFLLIRRDELKSSINPKMCDSYSVKVEEFLAKQLSDRRILIAREYSKILLGSDEKLQNVKRILGTPIKEMNFFESIIDFSIQCVWIALYRRAFNTIKCEINRLFRTSFFNLARDHCQFNFDFREEQILFGFANKKNGLKNYRRQLSPAVCEILEIAKENEEILNIGEEKYQGTNKYLYHLELEYSLPECHLFLAGLRRGILGHPKYFYDTLLNLNQEAVRKWNFSEDYDPFGLVKRVFLKIHTADEFIEKKKHFPIKLILEKQMPDGTKQEKLWKRKRQVLRKCLKNSSYYSV